MQIYKAPLRDMRFVLHEMLDVEQLSKLPGYEEATADTIDAIIEDLIEIRHDIHTHPELGHVVRSHTLVGNLYIAFCYGIYPKHHNKMRCETP